MPLVIGSQVAFVAKFVSRRLAYTYEIRDLVPDEQMVMRTAEDPLPEGDHLRMGRHTVWHRISLACGQGPHHRAWGALKPARSGPEPTGPDRNQWVTKGATSRTRL